MLSLSTLLPFFPFSSLSNHCHYCYHLHRSGLVIRSQTTTDFLLSQEIPTLNPICITKQIRMWMATPVRMCSLVSSLQKWCEGLITNTIFSHSFHFLRPNRVLCAINLHKALQGPFVCVSKLSTWWRFLAESPLSCADTWHLHFTRQWCFGSLFGTVIL